MFVVTDQLRDFFEWWIGEIHCCSRAIMRGNRIFPLSGKRVNPRRAIFHPFVDGQANVTPIFRGRHLKLPQMRQFLPFSRWQEVSLSSALDASPFKGAAVYILPTVGSAGRLQSSVLIKRYVLNAFLDEVAETGGKLQNLGIDQNGATEIVPPRALERLHPAFAHLRHRRIFTAVMFTVLCLVITITYIHALVRYSASERQLSEIVETKQLEALQVRKLLDQERKSFDATAAARAGKAQSVPVTRLWEEVTRTVPDEAWISDFAFDGVSVTLSGYAEGSASLIGKLSASKLLKDPTFTSPVVRAPGQTGEHFELRARVALP